MGHRTHSEAVVASYVDAIIPMSSQQNFVQAYANLTFRRSRRMVLYSVLKLQIFCFIGKKLKLLNLE